MFLSIQDDAESTSAISRRCRRGQGVQELLEWSVVGEDVWGFRNFKSGWVKTAATASRIKITTTIITKIHGAIYWLHAAEKPPVFSLNANNDKASVSFAFALGLFWCPPVKLEDRPQCYLVLLYSTF